MANNQEEILLKLALNAESLKAGTMKVLDDQKKAALDYTSFWKKAISERENAEIAADQRRIQRERRLNDLLRERQSIQLQRYSRDWKNSQSMNGSGGSGWLETAEEAAGGAGMAAGGAHAMGHGNAGAMREAMVLMREMSRGNWSKVPGSLSILISRLGGLGAVATAAAAPLLALVAAVGAGATVFKWLQMKSAQSTEAASTHNLQMTDTRLAGHLQNTISGMAESGAISQEDAARLAGMLGKNPSSEKLRAIQRYLFGAQGKANAKAEGDASSIALADKAYEKSKAQLDELHTKERGLADITKDIAERQADIEFLKKNIATLDQKSVDYHQARARLMEKQVEQEKDVTKQKELQEHLDRKKEEVNKEYQRWSDKAAREYMTGKINPEESEYNSIENLAGRGWLKRFSAQYGAGGRFDLGRGDGPMGETAREYERAKYQQIWDRTYGNSGAAEQDRLRMVAARNTLIENGAASPAQLLSKIGDDTGSLRVLFNTMVENGVIIKGTD